MWCRSGGAPRTALLRSDADDLDRQAAPATVPTLLSTVERHQLSLLHRILGRLVDDSDEEGSRAEQLTLARVIERGYAKDYWQVFASVEPELPMVDAELVMDVLDMFTQLAWSVARPSDEERQSLGEDRLSSAVFDGFDRNKARESRLLAFAQYLIERGKWSSMAPHFQSEHDYGDSHSPMLEVYERMLAVFNPIWREKLRVRLGSDYRLDVDELQRVLDAAPYRGL